MTIVQLVPRFRPESALERELSDDPALLRGLAWGRPRPGHPEGSVGSHVADLLAAIPEGPGRLRGDLRFLALVHDSFKCRVRPDGGRTPDNDHAVLARRYAERYTADPRLLDTLELHDQPYRIWRAHGERRHDELAAVLAGIPDLELFLRFAELDGSTAGKDPRPLDWLRFVARAALGSGELRLAA